MSRPVTNNKSLINGHPADSISIYDRGLQYGDGLFETIAVVDGCPLLLEQHLKRLISSSELLKFPQQNALHLEQELIEFCSEMDKGIVKIILSRGAGGRGYGLPTEPSINRILIQYPWPEYPEHILSEGVSLRVCDLRLSKQPLLHGSKHLNRLEQILARSEWSDADIFEGVLLNEDDIIIECTMSNVFFIKGDTLITPELNESGVKGIIRDVIIEQAVKLGFKTDVRAIHMDELHSMHECFITNSIIGVCPVKEISNNRFNDIIQSNNIREYLFHEKMIANL